MLAADLIVSSVTATSSFVHFFGERSVKSTVVVENIGDAKSTGTMTLDLFLSRDDALGTGDYQLASRELPKILNASGRRVERFDELIPHDLSGIRQGSVLTPGDYRLIARITATAGATDSVTTNNTAVAAGLVPVQYEFGQVGQSTELTLRTTLPSFQFVEIVLKGPGTGRLIPNGNSAPTLELTGTTSRTDLRILTPNQFVSSTFAGITINGSIRKIYAPRTDISGNINISGSLGSMTIRDIVGSTWTIGGGQSPAVISLGIVQNSSLSSGQSIRSISAESWTTTDSGRDAIIAPWIGTLAIAGAFTPDLNLSGDGTSRVVLSKADITGAVSGQWDIIGGIKSLRAGSVATTFAANVTGAVSTFAVLGNMGGFCRGVLVRRILGSGKT